MNNFEILEAFKAILRLIELIAIYIISPKK